MSIIRLKIGAGEAKSGSYLAPILGQHQIPIMEFIKTFNNISTTEYNSGILVSLNLIKLAASPIRYKMKGVSAVMFLRCFLNGQNTLTILQLYDLFRLSFYNYSLNHKPRSKRAYMSSLLGTFSSLGKKFTIKF